MNIYEIIFVSPFLIIIFSLVCFGVYLCDCFKLEEEKNRRETEAERFKVDDTTRADLNRSIRQARKYDRDRAKRLRRERANAGYRRYQHYEIV